jgi:hypothetical protein
MENKKDIDTVCDALDRVVLATRSESLTGLARRIGVSKQAISKWRKTGLVPTFRALQMCWESDGAVTWMQLCPQIVREFNDKKGSK